MMAANSVAIKDAPPTNPPSTSGCEKISFAFAAFTLPPYKIEIFSENLKKEKLQKRFQNSLM